MAPVAGAARARVVAIEDRSTRVIEIAELGLEHPRVQPLPDGSFVIAGARCACRDGVAERNAVVVGPDGAVRSAFTLGDGIEDIQTSPAGSIWVSYFDEGVFGNHGWEPGGRCSPLGGSGLVCFAAGGGVQWRFEPPAGHDAICDCYALNVDGETAWAYYYTDFPLARIRAGRVRTWSTGVSGARAVAVAGGHVLIAGGYREQAGRALLGRLGEDAVRDLVQVEIVVPDGLSWTRMKPVGRGGTLHLCGDGRWFAVDVQAPPG